MFTTFQWQWRSSLICKPGHFEFLSNGSFDRVDWKVCIYLYMLACSVRKDKYTRMAWGQYWPALACKARQFAEWKITKRPKILVLIFDDLQRRESREGYPRQSEMYVMIKFLKCPASHITNHLSTSFKKYYLFLFLGNVWVLKRILSQKLELF